MAQIAPSHGLVKSVGSHGFLEKLRSSSHHLSANFRGLLKGKELIFFGCF